MAYSKEKQETLINTLEDVAVLVGENQMINDRKVGLNLPDVSHDCQEQAQLVRNGLFRVVVMGQFTTGKSTAINALIGAKVLPESMKPCTAILTYIRYGENDSEVEVHMKGTWNKTEDGENQEYVPGKVLLMSKDDFINEYSYTLEDEQECIETGTVARFSLVDYAVIYSKMPMLQGGVSITDSPGLQDKEVATNITMDEVSKAQAIIYLGGPEGYQKADYDYIDEHFHNCPNNVFFVLNMFDTMKRDKDREDVLETVKIHLKKVFTKSDNTIDEEFLNRRVFGISALNALDARRGYTFDEEKQTDMPINEIVCNNLIRKSYDFDKLEAELERFLTTDEKNIAQYSSVFHHLAEAFQAAKKRINNNLSSYQDKGIEKENNKEECEAIIERIEQSIKITETTFDNWSLQIQNCISEIITRCADNLGATWEQDLETLKNEVDFGLRSYFKLMINGFRNRTAREERLKEIAKPLSEKVSNYYKDNITRFIKNNQSVLDNIIKEAQNALNVELENTSRLIRELEGKISGISASPNNSKSTNWLQVLLSAYLGDLSKVVENMAGGAIPWGEFVKKTIWNAIWQAILVAALEWWAIPAIVLIEIIQANNGLDTQKKKLLTAIKNSCEKEMKSILNKSSRELNKKIAFTMNQKKEESCSENRRNLEGQKLNLQKLLQDINDINFNLAEESRRYDWILSEIKNKVKSSYEIVFEQELTEELDNL